MQLESLNAAWTSSLSRSPWARALRARFELPARFESWKAFDALVPVMDKRQLREVIEAGRESGRGNKVVWRATGGSTAEPFRFPVWQDEQDGAGLDIWLGRRRIGVVPDDSLFLIWGHSHLLGSGVQGMIAKAKRRLSDRLLGYTRFSAYDLSRSHLRQACDQLLRSPARYVLGYSTALDRFARVNMDRSDEIASMKLKAVIATAEGFPRPDSRSLVTRCFGAPAVMEYGAVETGPLAYERLAGGGYEVFWARHRLEPIGGRAVKELAVTSLYPRALPLMRYALGDLAQVDDDRSGGSITRLDSVVGRCHETVTLPSGATVHSEAFTHCMREASGALAFQVVAARGSWPRLRYEAQSPLGDNVVADIRGRLAVIEPQLASTPMERVDRLAPSVAGKHRMVVDS